MAPLQTGASMISKLPSPTVLSMAPRSFFLRFKGNVKSLIKLSFRSKRKPRPPSPTTSIILPDTRALDGTHSLDETECNYSVDLDPNMWREILSYCEVIDIIHVGMTCWSLASVTEDFRVWYFALLRICHNRRLPHLRFRMKSLSGATLRRKAILSTRLDHLSRGLDLRPFPYTTTTLSLPVSAVWGISFLPGGEWLVVLCRQADKDGVMLCRASNPLDQLSTYSVSGWHLTKMCIFTSDDGDLLLLLRSDHHYVTKLEVYLVHLSDSCPRLEMVWTIEVPEIVNCTALGSYIVYGWIDRSNTKPRHLMTVSKLESCYRKLAGYCTMEVEWEVGKWPHSYGLRVTDSQIIVLASSRKLIAAYKVPLIVPASVPCEPMTVTSFWHFSCAQMCPRAIFLVPSLPAVDTPSIIVLYGNRCLFITPSFDTDPLQRHPTYFSTYTYPHELKRPMVLGPHRAFWDLGRGRVGIGMLPAPVTPAFYEQGSWDMSGIHTPEADLADDVHPLGHAGLGLCKGKVAKAAWDEESGKLALCPKADSRLIIIADLMP